MRNPRPMLKKVVPLLIASTCLFTASTAFAEKGGKDGGGGDTRSSSTAEVVAAIHHVIDEPGNYIGDEAKDNIYAAFANLVYLPNQQNIRDKELLLVFAKMNMLTDAKDLKTSSVSRDLRSTSFDIRLTRNCPADDARKETHGYTERRLGAPICLGVPLLRRIPKEALTFQIRALVAHELAHHFGYDEDVANKVQNFFLYQNVGTVDFDVKTFEMDDLIHYLESQTREKSAQISQAKTISGRMCYSLGKLETYASKLESTIRDGMAQNRTNPYSPTQFRQYWAATQEILDSAEQLENYCYYQGSNPYLQLVGALDALNAKIVVLGKSRHILFQAP